MPKARPNPAVSEILQEDGELDAILSGRGLSFERASGPPPVPPGPPLEVEPPPWAGQPSPGLLPASEPSDPTLLGAAALAELKQRNGDTDEPRFTPGPPLQSEPLRRPVPAEVDWQEEERLRRQAEAPAVVVEEAPSRYPPPRREP